MFQPSFPNFDHFSFDHDQVFNNQQQFLSVPLPDHMEAPPNAPDDSSFFLPPPESIDPFSNSPSNPFFHPPAEEEDEGQDIEDPFSLLTLPPDVQDRSKEHAVTHQRLQESQQQLCWLMLLKLWGASGRGQTIRPAATHLPADMSFASGRLGRPS